MKLSPLIYAQNSNCLLPTLSPIQCSCPMTIPVHTHCPIISRNSSKSSRLTLCELGFLQTHIQAFFSILTFSNPSQVYRFWLYQMKYINNIAKFSRAMPRRFQSDRRFGSATSSETRVSNYCGLLAFHQLFVSSKHYTTSESACALYE